MLARRVAAPVLVTLGPDRRNEHIAAECADRIEQNSANCAREIAARNTADARNELVASQPRVIDMNDAVGRREADGEPGRVAQDERKRRRGDDEDCSNLVHVVGDAGDLRSRLQRGVAGRVLHGVADLVRRHHDRRQ